jgi:hypothetical protein
MRLVDLHEAITGVADAEPGPGDGERHGRIEAHGRRVIRVTGGTLHAANSMLSGENAGTLSGFGPERSVLTSKVRTEQSIAVLLRCDRPRDRCSGEVLQRPLVSGVRRRGYPRFGLGSEVSNG